MKDAEIVKSVKECMDQLGCEDENMVIIAQACAQMLCSILHRCNSTLTKIELTGVTYEDKPIGDWVVTVRNIHDEK